MTSELAVPGIGTQREGHPKHSAIVEVFKASIIMLTSAQSPSLNRNPAVPNPPPLCCGTQVWEDHMVTRGSFQFPRDKFHYPGGSAADLHSPLPQSLGDKGPAMKEALSSLPILNPAVICSNLTGSKEVKLQAKVQKKKHSLQIPKHPTICSFLVKKRLIKKIDRPNSVL